MPTGFFTFITSLLFFISSTYGSLDNKQLMDELNQMNTLPEMISNNQNTETPFTDASANLVNNEEDTDEVSTENSSIQKDQDGDPFSINKPSEESTPIVEIDKRRKRKARLLTPHKM